MPGAKPGERRGGRKAGVPNKMSSTRVERALQEGRRLPPENLLLLADNQLAMAERYQPEITDKDTGALAPNPNFVEERYDHWMARARETLAAAAPYYAPKLHVMAAEVHHTPQVSISQKLKVTMSPQEAMEAYIKMIDAKPL
jgi:hypothetical protein